MKVHSTMFSLEAACSMKKCLAAAAFSLLALHFASAVQAAERPVWRAGVASTVITPEKLMWMSGYADRKKPAEGKLHDLWAKALVLEDPSGRRGVLVSFDLIGSHRNQSLALRKELKEKYGLDPSQVMLAFS